MIGKRTGSAVNRRQNLFFQGLAGSNFSQSTPTADQPSAKSRHCLTESMVYVKFIVTKQRSDFVSNYTRRSYFAYYDWMMHTEWSFIKR